MLVKQTLHGAVVWRDGKPVLVGDDAPEPESELSRK